MKQKHAETPQRRILAVDDDPVSTLIIEEALAGQFLIDTARSGEEALECFTRVTPDLVLLDVMMDGIDGFEVCAALRARPGGKTLPVVMLTSQDDTESIAQAFQVGATDFISKPINAALLPYRLNYLLRAQETLRALDQRE